MKLLIALVGTIAVLIVMGYAIPILWPLATTASANITAMSGTDAGTSTVKAFYPIVMVIVGLGMGVGIIIFGLKKLGLLSGGRGGLD